MFGAICVFFFKLLGWKIVGDFPNKDVPKYIIIVAPHTSYWDYPIGVATRRIKKIDAKYLGKKELFAFPPLGWFMRSMGGYPVDRGKKSSMTDAIIDLFDSKEYFSIAITPEGTRSKVDKWKTGFWVIAKKAHLPIVRVAFDFGNKRVLIEKPEYVSDNMEADIERYKAYYRGIKGMRPELGVS